MNMVRVPMTALRSRGADFVERALKVGKQDGDFFVVHPSDHFKLFILGRTDRPQPTLPPAPSPVAQPVTISDLTVNFVSATSRWAAAGFPIVPESVFQERLGICRKCVDWDEAGNLGMGKCKRCGCTRIKLTWATEGCRLKKWIAIAT